ncbi:MAG: UDP-N-acetylglucosamine 2-epimerase [Nanoarchaeota archaeon]|nr:UDP-N-acetylglucosamine 2-epimerase [Nanoarchaeota archaeon]
MEILGMMHLVMSKKGKRTTVALDKGTKADKELASYAGAKLEAETISWYKRLSKMDVSGKPLRDRFLVDGLSFWWIMESWMFDSIAYYPRMRDILWKTGAYISLIDKEKPDMITYLGEENLDYAVLKECCSARKVRFKAELTGKEEVSRQRMGMIYHFLNFRYVVRKLYGYLLPGKSSPERPVLVFPPHHWKHIFDPVSKRFIVGDPYTTPVVNALKKKVSTLSVDTAGEHMKEFGLGRMRQKRNGHTWFENYLCWSDFSAARKERKRLQKEAEKASKSLKDVDFNGVKVWKLFERQFYAYFEYRLMNHLIMHRVIGRMLDKVKPRAIFFSAETGDYGKIIFHLAAKRGIPVIAMQHGVLNLDIRCFREKDDGCPLPSVTAVYGQMDKDFLVKEGNYEPSTVMPIGSQRFDVIAFSDKLYDKKEIRKDLGLTQKKTVFIATQPIPELEIRYGFIREACNVLKELPVDVIIKVHPTEEEEPYRKLAKEIGIKRCIVTKSYDSYKAMYASDLVIIATSTIGLEAMIMGKPVMVVNFTGKPDEVPYALEGAALAARTPKEVKQRLEEWHAGKAGLEAGMKRYVKMACAYTDGKSSQRIAKLILKKIKP